MKPKDTSDIEDRFSTDEVIYYWLHFTFYDICLFYPYD